MPLKSIIISILIFICSTGVDAQIKWKVGMQWEYELKGSMETKTKFSIPKDTIVDNKNCLILLSEHYSCSMRPMRDIVYQDGSKIYYYHRDDQGFQLLYDFNADVGDTLPLRLWERIGLNSDYFYFLVDSIEYIDYSYISIKKFFYRSGAERNGVITFGDYVYEVLEGIGCTLNLFYLPNNGICDGPGVQNLICLDHPDFGIYTENSNECELTTSYDEDSGDQESILIYPNPTNQTLRIATRYSYREIEIYDLAGRKVIKSNPINYIDVSNLNNGMYFIKFISDTSDRTFKFLVQ